MMLSAKGDAVGLVQTSQLVPASPAEVFRYMADLHHVPETLRGHIEVEFERAPPKLGPHVEFELLMTRFLVTAKIICRVDEWVPGQRLSYIQLAGFFRKWSHWQILEEHDQNVTRLTDVAEFKMPGGLLGHLADDLFVRAEVRRLLQLRAQRIRDHFASLVAAP